jgi:hypothetical protein
MAIGRPIVAGWTARGRFLCILEGSASIARDCKRDIYSRFLYTRTSKKFLYIIIIITLYHLYTFNRSLLHLIIVYLLLVCILLLLYVYICVLLLAYCLVSWYRSCRVSSGWGPPPYTIQWLIGSISPAGLAKSFGLGFGYIGSFKPIFFIKTILGKKSGGFI